MTFTIEKIPPLNRVAVDVMAFDVEDPSADIAKLESIIKADMGISSDLLKIANSAQYGRSGKIKSLREAITLLGIKTIKNLVIMLNTNKFKVSLKSKTFIKYVHELPVLTALVALDLSRPMEMGAQKEAAFLNGLLAKVGITIIALQKPGHYSALLKLYENAGEQGLVEVEEENYGTNHIKLGAEAFKHWGMPPEMIDIMNGQALEPAELGSTSDIVRITILSGLVVYDLLNIPTSSRDDECKRLICEHYKLSSEKMAAFDADYFELLKEHPFYQQALQG